MTGKAAYITVKRGKSERLSLPGRTVLLFCLGSMFLFGVSSVLKNASDQTREEFIEALRQEKKIVEMNKALKMELLAITQKGYVEFAAEERLGLKKPTDAEVVILK